MSFVAATAQAGPQEKNTVTSALTRPFDWTGFYIGANLGGALSDYQFDGSGEEEDLLSDVDVAGQIFGPGTGVPFTTFFGPSDEDRRGSLIGGGQVGYNRQFGHFVVGVEGDFERTSLRGSTSFRDFATTTVLDAPDEIVTADTSFFGRRNVESNWNASARLRLGYATGPVLLYGTAGIAFADVRTWAHDIATSDFFVEEVMNPVPRPAQGAMSFAGRFTNTNISRDDDTYVGWTAGGGIEVAFGDAVTFALEYRHNGFGDENFSFSNNGTPIFPGPVNVDLDSDQVTVRMNILLNHMFGGSDGFSSGLVRASAKDKNVALAPLPEEFSWTGPYIGANVGGVWTDFDFSGYETDVDGLLFSTPATDDGSDDSVLGGGQLGFQKQWGHFVLGVEGDFSGMSSQKNTDFASTILFVSDVDAYDVTTLKTQRLVNVNWHGSARARLGWAQGHILLYATAGGVWAGVDTSSSTFATTDFFTTRGVVPVFEDTVTARTGFTDNDIVGGWTAGAGSEWAFNNVFSVGMEYRHNEFDDVTFGTRRRGFITSGGSNVDLDSDQLTFKVNVLLGTLFRRQ